MYLIEPRFAEMLICQCGFVCEQPLDEERDGDDAGDHEEGDAPWVIRDEVLDADELVVEVLERIMSVRPRSEML